MLDWLLGSSADRRLLGGSRLRGPTPWVIAIMSFSIMIVAAAGLALASTAALLSTAIQSRYAIEIPAGGGGQTGALLHAVKSAPGVTSASAVPESEMRRTLERWLGSAAESKDLPVPALINFDLRAGASLKPVEQTVNAIAPAARIVAHEAEVGPLLSSLRLLQWLAFGLVALLSAATAAAVVLAARGALDTHRFTIEVMHGIGATDLQVTNLFQRRIAIDALGGSLAGAAAAAIVLLLLTTGASFVADLTGGATLTGIDIVILVLIPFALAGLATWVARAAVLAALREAL